MVNEEKSIYLSRLCEQGDLQEIKRLNECYNLDFEIYNNEAIRRACKFGHFDIVKYLTDINLHGTKAVDMRKEKNLGFDYAAENGYFDIVNYFLYDEMLKQHNKNIILCINSSIMNNGISDRRGLSNYINTGQYELGAFFLEEYKKSFCNLYESISKSDNFFKMRLIYNVLTSLSGSLYINEKFESGLVFLNKFLDIFDVKMCDIDNSQLQIKEFDKRVKEVVLASLKIKEEKEILNLSLQSSQNNKTVIKI